MHRRIRRSLKDMIEKTLDDYNDAWILDYSTVRRSIANDLIAELEKFFTIKRKKGVD